jgi:hypothetical protein
MLKIFIFGKRYLIHHYYIFGPFQLKKFISFLTHSFYRVISRYLLQNKLSQSVREEVCKTEYHSR